MKLIVISAPHPVTRERELVRGMLKEELTHFHLRRPSWSLQELEACILGYTEQERKTLVLHSHHDLVPKYGLKVGASGLSTFWWPENGSDHHKTIPTSVLRESKGQI